MVLVPTVSVILIVESARPTPKQSFPNEHHCTCRCQSFSVTLNLFSPSFRDAQISSLCTREASRRLRRSLVRSRCVWHIEISFRENRFTAASHRYIVPWIYARRHNILFISFWFSYFLSVSLRLATFKNNSHSRRHSPGCWSLVSQANSSVMLLANEVRCRTVFSFYFLSSS